MFSPFLQQSKKAKSQKIVKMKIYAGGFGYTSKICNYGGFDVLTKSIFRGRLPCVRCIKICSPQATWRSWEGSSVFVYGNILSQCVRLGQLCGAEDDELRRAANLDA